MVTTVLGPVNGISLQAPPTVWSMRRYVILEHDHPNRHWDLMIEDNGALKTWRLARPPHANTPVEAEPIPDHRLAYLDYEGPVSGGRGHVVRWDAGHVVVLRITGDTWETHVAGQRLDGTLHLQQHTNGSWECVYSPSEPEAGR
jgi:hypothetical protein